MSETHPLSALHTPRRPERRRRPQASSASKLNAIGRTDAVAHAAWLGVLHL
jgi:hypothetical protein